MWNSERSSILMIITSILLTLGFLIYVWVSASSAGEFAKASSAPKFSGIYEGGTRESEENMFLSLNNKDILTPALEALGETLKSIPAPAVKQAQNPNSPPANEITLTKQEIFEFGYDVNYRAALSRVNQIMISRGFLKPNEIYPVTNFAEANALQDKIADFLLYLAANSENGGHTPEQVDAYRRAYRETLPRLWEEELRAQRMSVLSAPPKNIFYKYKEIYARKERERIFSLLFPIANAQEVTAPECYRHGVPNMIRGSQLASLACNDGYFCSKGCKYFSDCGPGSAKCNVPTGCLNLMCPGMPAIWDPVTKICGCWI